MVKSGSDYFTFTTKWMKLSLLSGWILGDLLLMSTFINAISQRNRFEWKYMSNTSYFKVFQQILKSFGEGLVTLIFGIYTCIYTWIHSRTLISSWHWYMKATTILYKSCDVPWVIFNIFSAWNEMLQKFNL